MNEELNKRIRTLIRQKRKEKGINQAQLGEMIGLSRTSVVNIEQGTQQLTIENLYLFAQKFGCSVYSLLPDTKPKIRLKLVRESVVVGIALA